MKRLTENILTDAGNFNFCRAYSSYVGYFEHTRENGEVMLIKIAFKNNHNDKHLFVSLFIKEQAFVQIASFNDIAGVESISEDCRGDKFVEAIYHNNDRIEEWLNIVFH